MSGILTTPTAEIKVGGTSIASQNIMECQLHLGCTREVSTFAVVVDNSNPSYFSGQYSPGGAKVFTKGNTVTIKIKRGTIDANTNYLFTGVLEVLEYIDEAEEYQYRNVVVLSGKCNGTYLFDRKYDGDLITDVGTSYQSYKRTSGEAESLVAYLIDYYTADPNNSNYPLSHVRESSLATGDAASGQRIVDVTDGSIFAAGDLVAMMDDLAWEYNKVSSVNVNQLTMVSNLVNSYTTANNFIVGLDLIRDTDTNYTKMEFNHDTVFDILKFIADTADTSGTIGYDSRIEYDGKYAFLPRGLVTESYSLSAQVQTERYLDDSTRIKNKITVYGKADKPFPIDVDGQNYSDSLTELWSQTRAALASNASSGQRDVVLTSAAGFSEGDVVWLVQTHITEVFTLEKYTVDSIASNTLTMTENLTTSFTTAKFAICVLSDYDSKKGWFGAPTINATDTNITLGNNDTPQEGSYEIEVDHNNAKQSANVFLILPDGYEVNMTDFHILTGLFYFTNEPYYVRVRLRSGDCTVNETSTSVKFSGFEAGEWKVWTLDLNQSSLTGWTEDSSFDVTNIKMVEIYIWWNSTVTTQHFSIDKLYFLGGRWGGYGSNVVVANVDGFAEDATSQSIYGIKEHVVVNDLILSDADCEAKAQSLLEFYSNPRVTIIPDSKTVDWGDYPIIPGNKVAVNLTPLGISDNYRIDAVDIKLTSVDHELIATFEMDATPPRTADYLQGIVERLKIVENSLENIAATTSSGARTYASTTWNGGYVTNPTYFEAKAQVNDTWEELDVAGFEQKLYRTATNEPEDYPFEAREAELRWWDETTGGYVNAFPFLLTMGEESTPWLLIDQALAVRKDFYALGVLTTGEGVLTMYGGVGWGPDGFDSNPFVWLGKGGDYGSKNSLEIRRTVSGDWGWGNLKCGAIYVSGTEVITSAKLLQNVTANASIITAGTLDLTRIPSIPASQTTSGVFDQARIPWTSIPNSGIQIGSGDIYWQTATTPDVLETSVPWIFDSSVQIGDGLSVTGAIGSTGDITVGGGDIYIGNRRLYEDGSYLRSTSGFVSDSTITVGSLVNTTYAGPLYVDANHTIGYDSSSIRFKTNIRPLDSKSILKLNPVRFDWKDSKRQKSEGTRIGLIAEEVAEVFPELVFYDRVGKPLGVHYEWLAIPMLTEMKRLRDKITKLENKIEELNI